MFKKKLFQLCVELTNGDLSSKTLKKLTKSNLSRLLIQPFAKVYDINTDEILDELDDFKNLNEFFTRKLRPDARPIDQNENSFVSPTDGVISEVGVISDDRTFVVKNQTYNVQTLVGDSELADKDNILSYNYRQVYRLNGKINYTLIPVGAQNVNSIIPTYDDIYVKKGEELGYFEFGSTVVLLFEKDNIILEDNLKDREIKMGEKIATIL